MNDAEAVLAAAETAPVSEEARDAIGLLALIVGQDVEPGEEEGTWRIAKKVAKDRVISTVDTEARHGHKSTAVRTDGFKVHLATEPDTGIITAVQLTPANHPDGPVGVALMKDEPDGLEVLADSAYGSGAVRTAFKDKHHRLVIKPLPSRPRIPGGFVRDDFAVDHDERWVTCPAGHVARLSSGGIANFAPHCRSCPLRSRCTKAKARSFTVSEHDFELVAARAAWRDSELRRCLSTAPPDGRALDRLARREGEPTASLSRSRAQRGLAQPTRRGAQLAQARRARSHEKRRHLGARRQLTGPRERPKEGTTPAVKRPTSAAGSHPLPRLFGAGLPPRTQNQRYAGLGWWERPCSTGP